MVTCSGTGLGAGRLVSGNPLLPSPHSHDRLDEIAAALGADVPFFLRDGPQLGTGDGSLLEPVDLPQDYWVLLVVPHGGAKESTAAVYERFDERGGEAGFADRRQALVGALQQVRRARDLASLPPNDLASSPLAERMLDDGAFRADVTGAGPAVYGLFVHRRTAVASRQRLRRLGRTWLTAPAWYV